MGAEYQGIRDMLDGGGAGQSGDRFEGGIMSALANDIMQDRGYSNPLDMIDGGGAGQSGDQFEGGGLMSLIANLASSPVTSAPPPSVTRVSSRSAPPPAPEPTTLLPYEGGPQATTFNEQLAVDRANADNRQPPPWTGGVLPPWSPSMGIMPDQHNRLIAQHELADVWDRLPR